MRDDTIRLYAWRTNAVDYVVLAQRLSDGKVDLYYVGPALIARWTATHAFPDVRRFYPVQISTVAPGARAKIRAVFDARGVEWQY